MHYFDILRQFIGTEITLGLLPYYSGIGIVLLGMYNLDQATVAQPVARLQPFKVEV